MQASQGNLNKSKVNKDRAIINIDKDPVCLLHEVFENVSCLSSLVTGIHNKCCFKVKMIVKGRRYSSKATTLKLAKKLCALAALADLCNVCYDNNKMQLYVNVPVPSIKILDSDDVIIVDEEKAAEVKPECSLAKGALHLNEPGTLISTVKYLPLTIEELDNDDKVVASNRQTNVLLNINNSSLITKTELKEKTKRTTQCNNLSIMTCVKTVVQEEVQTNLKMLTWKRNTCIKSYAKNPIEINESDQIENSRDDLTMSVTLKRHAEDSPGFLEEVPAKRSVLNTVSKVYKRKIIWFKGKNSQKFYQTLKFTLEAEMGSEYAPFFTVSTVLNGRKFYGHQKSKQLAERDIILQIMNEIKKYGHIQLNNINDSEHVDHLSSLQRCSQFNEDCNVNNTLQLPTWPIL